MNYLSEQLLDAINSSKFFCGSRSSVTEPRQEKLTQIGRYQDYFDTQSVF